MAATWRRAGDPAPTWREEDADWTAHDEEFEPAMFGDDEVALGSLDETDDTDVERRPWEFDLDDTTSHPITEPTAPVTARTDEPAEADLPTDGPDRGSDPRPDLTVGFTAATSGAAEEPAPTCRAPAGGADNPPGAGHPVPGSGGHR